MATVEVINMNGEKTGEIDLKDNIFGIEANQNAMHTAVIYYLANQRQGTKCTKTRAEVRGGGRKPWRQKGTGRARQGSIRSPQWRKGGVVFAPKPRDFSFKINKKLKRLAIKSALSTRLSEKKLIVMDKLELDEIKTKVFAKIVMNINLNGKKTLFVINNNAEDLKSSKNVILSARNLFNVKTIASDLINTYTVLNHEYLVLTIDAVNKIQEVFA